MFYCYVLCNPLSPGDFRFGRYRFPCEPFYVGKGMKGRYKDHAIRAQKKCKGQKEALIRFIIRSGQEVVVKRYECASEEEAFDLEIRLIAKVGRADLGEGPLLNYTDGGEGGAGHVQSPKLRKRRSVATKAHWDSLSSEERKARGDKVRATKQAWSENRSKEVGAKMLATRGAWSTKQKKRIAVGAKEAWSRKSVEQKSQFSETCSRVQHKRRVDELKYRTEEVATLKALCRFRGLKLLSEFQGTFSPVQLQCSHCGHQWERLARYCLAGSGCPICVKEENQVNYKWASMPISAFGKTKTIRDWAKSSGLTEQTIQKRVIHGGQSPEHALSSPRKMN